MMSPGKHDNKKYEAKAFVKEFGESLTTLPRQRNGSLLRRQLLLSYKEAMYQCSLWHSNITHLEVKP
jgi:hypothetical protein